MDAGEEAGLFINAVGRPLAALATVVEGAPARQIGALEGTQGDGRCLEVQQVAAQDGAQRGEVSVGGAVGHPCTMRIGNAPDHAIHCKSVAVPWVRLIRFRHKPIRAGHFR